MAQRCPPDMWIIADDATPDGPLTYRNIRMIRKAAGTRPVVALCADRPLGARLGCLRAGADWALSAPYAECWPQLRNLLGPWRASDPASGLLEAEGLVAEVCHDLRNAAVLNGLTLTLPQRHNGRRPEGQGVPPRGLRRRASSPQMSAAVLDAAERLACLTRLSCLVFQKVAPQEIVSAAAERLSAVWGREAVTMDAPKNPLPTVWADAAAVVHCLVELAVELAGEARAVDFSTGIENGGVALKIRVRDFLGPGHSSRLPGLEKWRLSAARLAHVKLCAVLHDAWAGPMGSSSADAFVWFVSIPLGGPLNEYAVRARG